MLGCMKFFHKIMTGSWDYFADHSNRVLKKHRKMTPILVSPQAAGLHQCFGFQSGARKRETNLPMAVLRLYHHPIFGSLLIENHSFKPQLLSQIEHPNRSQNLAGIPHATPIT